MKLRAEDYVWIGAGIAMIVAFILAAAWKADPHMAQRGGALLTAYSGAMIIYIAFFERALSREGKGKDEIDGLFGRLESPISRLARRLHANAKRAREEELEDRRIVLIVIHSALAITGELLHGFGDLGVKLFLTSGPGVH